MAELCFRFALALGTQALSIHIYYNHRGKGALDPYARFTSHPLHSLTLHFILHLLSFYVQHCAQYIHTLLLEDIIGNTNLLLELIGIGIGLFLRPSDSEIKIDKLNYKWDSALGSSFLSWIHLLSYPYPTYHITSKLFSAFRVTLDQSLLLFN